NNDLRFRCSSNVWRSCSAPRGTWDWTTENLIAGDKRDGRCCDPSQIGEKKWSYCGDGKCNTACGENGNTCISDCCSAEVCTLGTGDEDCDSETNWDSSDGIHGDNNCAVGVTAVAVSDTTPCPGETITVSCTSTVANINSIQAFIDSTNIESGFLGWSGSVARFQWPAPSTTGSHTVKCSIDTSKSYKSGTDKTTTITVGGSSCCSQYTPSGSGTCEADTACDWCPECSSRQYSGGTGRCVATGTCSFACSVGSCTAQCDASTNPSCTIGGYPGIRNCNLATCLWGSCIPTGTCGDSITNGPEVCDSGAGNGVPCIPPYGGSCQYCSADCSQLLTVTGPSCGDDIIQSPPEQCDDGAGNGIPCTPPYAGTCNWCDNSCVTQTEIGPYCGDLIVNGPEACEGSACQAGCTTQRCDPSTCQYYNPSPESSCTDDIDNDCDCATDGCDAECQEGQGTNNRCCADGVDNDGDTYIDEDDPGCCDLCLTPFGFDDPAAACGTLTFNWELSPPSMNQRCCGDDSPSENFISTYIARYTSTFYACCDQPTDCVDQNGECQSGDEEQFDLCINGVDDDCDGYIDRADGSCQGVVTGIIFNEEGFRLDGAIVTGRPAGLGEAYESQSTLSDFNGNYVINNALIGTYNFVARREGYDDDIRTVTISTAGTTYQNFTLINGSCHADCTDYYKNCNPACEGQTFKEGTCNFITTLCHNRPKDFVVRYENTTTGMMHEFICCDGLETINPVIKATVTSQIENIYDFVAKVKYRGSFANFHMLVWNSED
ncbi:MAG: carboxypeptidase-like regulatory domain-containing protein, partial [Nanoarchaeota archaeon]|nr:carboxypeptidase-like regulatory domain-containing protein [Nanoarchaeota archaeon]